MKTSSNTAIKLILPLVESLRWGRPESIAEAGNNLAGALDVSHPAVAIKLRSLTSNANGIDALLGMKSPAAEIIDHNGVWLVADPFSSMSGSTP